MLLFFLPPSPLHSTPVDVPVWSLLGLVGEHRRLRRKTKRRERERKGGREREREREVGHNSSTVDQRTRRYILGHFRCIHSSLPLLVWFIVSIANCRLLSPFAKGLVGSVNRYLPPSTQSHNTTTGTHTQQHIRIRFTTHLSHKDGLLPEFLFALFIASASPSSLLDVALEFLVALPPPSRMLVDSLPYIITILLRRSDV